MSRLIPVIYQNINYPSHIEANIHCLYGNFNENKLIANAPYSLHTEESYSNKIFSSKIINELENIKSAQKNNIPLLWRNKEWAHDFYIFIDQLIGKNKPPEVLEIHPPFRYYCNTFDQFFDIFDVFYQKFKVKYPTTKIFIENRFETTYKDRNGKNVKYLLSTFSDILGFCSILSEININLKIILDYPQIFSAETDKSERWDSKHGYIGIDSAQLFEKILWYNRQLKKYSDVVGGLHIWGMIKRKDGKGWKAHAGNFDTFFDTGISDTFLSSVFSILDDDIVRYFLPEINSGEKDLNSIVTDMENAGFVFESPVSDP